MEGRIEPGGKKKGFEEHDVVVKKMHIRKKTYNECVILKLVNLKLIKRRMIWLFTFDETSWMGRKSDDLHSKQKEGQAVRFC